MNNQPSEQNGIVRAKMQVVTVFDLDRTIRTHHVTGIINLPAFHGILKGLYTSKQFNPDMHALWDLRLADFSGVMPEDVRALMHVVVNNWGRSGKCHCAILVASPAEYGVARIYVSQFGRAAPCKIKVFLDLCLAQEWLAAGDGSVESVTTPNQVESQAGG